MKRRLKTIQANLFCLTAALVVTSILIFGIFFYNYTSGILKSRASQAHQSLCQSISEKLDAEVIKMNTVSMNICYSSLIKSHFIKYLSYVTPPADPEHLLKAEQYYDSKELMDIIMAVIGPFQTVSQINLYDFNGEMVGAGLANSTAKVILNDQPWYRQVLQRNGDKYISVPHFDPWLARVRGGSEGRRYLSLVRIIFDPNWTRQGIVEIKQDCGIVFHGLKTWADPEIGQKGIYVFNDRDELLFPYHPGVKLPEYRYLKGILSHSDQPVSTTVRNPSRGGREIVTGMTSPLTGWQVFIVESQRQVLAPVITFTRIVIGGGLALVLLTLAVSFLLAKKVTIPIQRIHRAIKKLNLEMLATETQPKLSSDLNELEELNGAFQNMCLQLKSSMDALLLAQSQEMQSKMLALQSQMNPHFLYNTLSTMIIMAEEGMNDAVVTIGKNVSQMLRYISSHKSPLVTLEEEIAHTRNYLECMKFRYRNNLCYEFKVDSRLNGVIIPKLLIQPLVENAVKHGCRNEPPWRIGLRAFIAVDAAGLPEGWRITISDNGPGFSWEKLMEIAQKLARFTENGLHPRLEPEGMGLLNIYIRLKLVYDDAAVFAVSNADHGGAQATIGGRLETPAVIGDIAKRPMATDPPA